MALDPISLPCRLTAMFRLDGKIALVTGASRGIGRACAIGLANAGATVLVNYVQSEARAHEVCEGIKSAGGKAFATGFDVADTKATETAIEALAKEHGKIDILIANAGIAIDGLLLRANDETFEKLFFTNVRGSIHCARVASKSMMKQRSGRIIFMSSVIAELGNAGQTLYGATKAAVLGATKSIAREYASRGITVNAIAPGFIDTEMTSTMTPEMKESLLKSIPLGRTGSAEDIAAACVFLSSTEAGYITGQTLRVNGGLYA